MCGGGLVAVLVALNKGKDATGPVVAGRAIHDCRDECAGRWPWQQPCWIDEQGSLLLYLGEPIVTVVYL
ncbi:F-box protein [Trichinella pseudospiralis]